MASHSNHLINETSPYLLQHAHNPVDWYPWGEEALEKARKEDKPILVSIGYAACHWCHVMERESFENEDTAKLMNEHFVNIKIDREERPDLDHIYMDAVQAMTGSGGWPLNAFLTPQGKPFYGGTYFPPVRAFNRMSWTEVLQSVAQAFTERRHEIDAQAENLTEHIIKSNSFGLQKVDDASQVFSFAKLDEAFQNIMNAADREWGGFGKAPKFPQTFTIQFLLRYHYAKTSENALAQALLSLDKMIDGGIYDQVGGGFARYSTDTEWLVPHFEKMLYDNALLVSVLSEAYQLTKNERYKKVIDETIGFIKRELLDKGNGFYAALDADSEGVEGRFYVWTVEEVQKILGEEAAIFSTYYDISEQGNWMEPHTREPGKNILRVKQPLQEFAAQNNIAPDKLEDILETGKRKLLAAREKRVRPLLDDKIILGWNALMNTACSKAFMATGNQEYRQLSIDNMQFVLNNFRSGESSDFNHTWKEGKARYPGFLDDYAYLVQALIHLQETTGDTGWLLKAREITEFVIDHFSEEESGFFYFTRLGQQDIIVRKKEVYDGAVPSGNAVMATNLYYLSQVFDIPEWKKRALEMVSSLGLAISRYPTSFGIWASLLQEIVAGTLEIAVIGKKRESLIAELYATYLPYKVLMSSDIENQLFPLLANKKGGDKPLIYLCKGYVCQQPVDTIGRFMLLINRLKIVN
jgi:uncharacterized protein YyaL (SSP411 family)